MMEFVAMKATHVPAVARLESSLFSAPWDEASLLSELSNPLALWLVALDGDAVAGYVGSQAVLGEADMMNLAVDPAYRSRGLARTLVQTLIDCLRESGVHCLTLEVRQSNGPAQALYASMGFGQVGLRPNYYSRPKEHAVILRKEWEV